MLVLSASQLDNAMRCPLRWHLNRTYRANVEGMQLEWGSRYHTGTAMFDAAMEEGIPKEQATIEMLRETVLKPWKVNLATEPHTTPATLARALVWYTEEPIPYIPLRLRGVAPTSAAVEKYALEVPFVFPIIPGVVVVGKLDGLVHTRTGEYAILERKTTKTSISDKTWYRYERDPQTMLYSAVGRALWPELHLAGVMVELCQKAVSFNRWERRVIAHSPDATEEFMRQVRHLVTDEMARWVADGYYPQRYSQCAMCDWRGLCKMSPAGQVEKLKSEYVLKPGHLDDAGLERYITPEIEIPAQEPLEI